MAEGVDMKNIRMNVIHVVLVVVNLACAAMYIAKRDAKLEVVADTAARIEAKQDKEAEDNKIWKAKIEADIADLKVRTALLEARINSIVK